MRGARCKRRPGAGGRQPPLPVGCRWHTTACVPDAASDPRRAPWRSGPPRTRGAHHRRPLVPAVARGICWTATAVAGRRVSAECLDNPSPRQLPAHLPGVPALSLPVPPAPARARPSPPRPGSRVPRETRRPPPYTVRPRPATGVRAAAPPAAPNRGGGQRAACFHPIRRRRPCHRQSSGSGASPPRPFPAALVAQVPIDDARCTRSPALRRHMPAAPIERSPRPPARSTVAGQDGHRPHGRQPFCVRSLRQRRLAGPPGSLCRALPGGPLPRWSPHEDAIARTWSVHVWGAQGLRCERRDPLRRLAARGRTDG